MSDLSCWRSTVGLLAIAVSVLQASAKAQDVHVTIHADRVVHPISPYLAGACLEDVNHEVYGGIYSQMLFGESFQEPAFTPSPTGFRVLGGQWAIRDGELLATGIPGDKVVSETPPFTNGEVHVEVFIADRQTTNAGLIVRVGKATAGMDTFDGYEVSLNAAAQHVLLGRHRHNWERIRDTPCEIPIGQWVPLAVKLNDRTIEISVNGKSVLKYEDDDKALLSGTVGLRQFQKEAKYRKLWIKTGDETRQLEFTAPAEPTPEVSGMWRAIQTGSAKGKFALEQKKPFVGRQSQGMTFVEGQGDVGIENQGLNRWGVHFVEGRPYEGTLWAKTEKPVDLVVMLQSRDGSQTHAETKVTVKPGEWQRLRFELTPKAPVERGRFAISLKQPGSVELGYAFLQPGAWGRYKGLPVRRDVVKGLIDQGIRVLRYGGSMVNHPEYRWKKMVGPHDRRPPHNNTWYPYSTNGWGIIEFLDLCDALEVPGTPTINMDESPEDMADFIDYVNGPATTEWGRKRSESSHPAPYNLKSIQLGNEERVDDVYFAKFQKLAAEIWKHDPQITIVVGDFVYSDVIRDPFNFKGAASNITTLAAHQKILQLAKNADREVWFDLHVGTDGPRPDSTLAATLSFVDALEKLADGAKFKVVVFELNSGNHTQRRAIANALAINAIARDGRIPIVIAANCLQPDGQNDNGWDQGLLFLNPSQVWIQPPGYVMQMVSSNYQPTLVQCEAPDAGDRLDLLTTISEDGKTLVLQAINPTDRDVTSQIEVKGFAPQQHTAKGLELSGSLAARNTSIQPMAIAPQQREWKHSLGTKATSYTFPPHSITMLKVE
ncbi:MAG TPA: family 16 glycoside hydrolase [Schlesneria sp.]